VAVGPGEPCEARALLQLGRVAGKSKRWQGQLGIPFQQEGRHLAVPAEGRRMSPALSQVISACLNEEQVSHEHRQKIGFAARMPTCSGGQLTLRCILLFLLASNLSDGETPEVFSMIRSFRCMSFARNLRGSLCVQPVIVTRLKMTYLGRCRSKEGSPAAWFCTMLCSF